MHHLMLNFCLKGLARLHIPGPWDLARRHKVKSTLSSIYITGACLSTLEQTFNSLQS